MKKYCLKLKEATTKTIELIFDKKRVPYHTIAKIESSIFTSFDILYNGEKETSTQWVLKISGSIRDLTEIENAIHRNKIPFLVN
jgi:hypothetical protein